MAITHSSEKKIILNQHGDQKCTSRSMMEHFSITLTENNRISFSHSFNWTATASRASCCGYYLYLINQPHPVIESFVHQLEMLNLYAEVWARQSEESRRNRRLLSLLSAPRQTDRQTIVIYHQSILFKERCNRMRSGYSLPWTRLLMAVKTQPTELELKNCTCWLFHGKICMYVRSCRLFCHFHAHVLLVRFNVVVGYKYISE